MQSKSLEINSSDDLEVARAMFPLTESPEETLKGRLAVANILYNHIKISCSIRAQENSELTSKE